MGLIVKESPIHGVGLFTNVPLEAQMPLFLAITLDGVVTPIARYINHSNQANTYMIHVQDFGWVVFGKHAVPSGDELTIDYRSAPAFILPPESHWQ
jgi:hypothetical protein